MKTLLKTIVLALILTVASTAFAQQSSAIGDQAGQQGSIDRPIPVPFDADKEQVERAKLLLSGYHGLPSKETFEQALDHPKAIVYSLAADKDGFSLHRKRALSALGYWADAGVLRLYVQLLQDDQTADAIRHRLVMLVAEHFPKEALGHLKPYLSHSDLQYRLTAIEAIRRIPTDEAVAALEAALATEKNEVARKRLEKYTKVAR